MKNESALKKGKKRPNQSQTSHHLFPSDVAPDALFIISKFYTSVRLKITHLQIEPESTDYAACRFFINNFSIVFRSAKRTPTKIGHFVTLWKRPHVINPSNPIIPLDSNDHVDFVIILVTDEKNKGQFIFSKEVLVQQGIMSDNGKGGKRAIRVYAPWTKPTAQAALKTQQWQTRHFFAMNENATKETTNQILTLLTRY
jgi:hypothetical protein